MVVALPQSLPQWRLQFIVKLAHLLAKVEAIHDGHLDVCDDGGEALEVAFLRLALLL